MTTVVKTSRPKYRYCECNKVVFYQDYIQVLTEAGVDPYRIIKDLLLKNDCCLDFILRSLPQPNPEAEARLRNLKDITLDYPPPFYQSIPGEEIRPLYLPVTKGQPTNKFLGAELYYYLVERGERPETILDKLDILSPVDRDKILEVTERPQTSFECVLCGEHFPHYKLLSHIFKKSSKGYVPNMYLYPPDIPERQCCVESVVSQKLTPTEEKELDEYLRTSIINSGVPIENVPFEQCFTCGSEMTKYHRDYAWLVHKGIPSKIALDYFGLNNLCCRGNVMNPRVILQPSMAAKKRQAEQIAAVPPPKVVKFNYEEEALPSISGTL